jgi:hypothetical protein
MPTALVGPACRSKCGGAACWRHCSGRAHVEDRSCSLQPLEVSWNAPRGILSTMLTMERARLRAMMEAPVTSTAAGLSSVFFMVGEGQAASGGMSEGQRQGKRAASLQGRGQRGCRAGGGPGAARLGPMQHPSVNSPPTSPARRHGEGCVLRGMQRFRGVLCAGCGRWQAAPGDLTRAAPPAFG